MKNENEKFTLAEKKFVKSTRYLSNFFSKISYFHEFFAKKRESEFPTLEITEFYCHGFSQKFRQINVLLKNFTIN